MMNFLTYITGFFMNFELLPIMQVRKKRGCNLKQIFSSETIEPISTKLCWNYSCVVLFQNCVRHFRTPTKRATTRTISYSSFKKKKERDKRENDLKNTLQKLQLGQVNNTEELNRVESELKKLWEDKIRGIIMRTKAKWNVEGERSSKYFCNLEKRHFTEKLFLI